MGKLHLRDILLGCHHPARQMRLPSYTIVTRMWLRLGILYV
jgi:hypothetical protein